MFSPCSGLAYNPKTCRIGELGNTKISSVNVYVFDGYSSGEFSCPSSHRISLEIHDHPKILNICNNIAFGGVWVPTLHTD